MLSCRGREGITPPSTVVEIAGLPEPRPSDILVVANGYDDLDSRFSGDFDTVVAAARGPRVPADRVDDVPHRRRLPGRARRLRRR